MADKKTQKKKTTRGKGKQDNSITVLKTVVKVLVAVLACLLLYMLITGAYHFGYKVFNKSGMAPEPGKNIEITVEKGDSALSVGTLLEKKGLIESRWVFVAQKVFYGNKIYPGTYELNTSMSGQQMLKIMGVKPVEETVSEEETSGEELETQEGTGGDQ